MGKPPFLSVCLGYVMRFVPALLLFCSVVCLSAFAPAPALAQSPPHQPPPSAAAAPAATTAAAASSIARLRDGRIDVTAIAERGTSTRWGRAVGVVDAPVETVMGIVHDYSRYAEFLPHFRVSRVLARRGTNAIVYMQASVIRNTTTIWAQMRVYARRSAGTTQIVEGRMLQGNVVRMAARWEVTPIDGGARSLVSFQFIVEPRLPFPASVFTDQNRIAARRTIEALQRRVNEPRFAMARNR